MFAQANIRERFLITYLVSILAFTLFYSAFVTAAYQLENMSDEVPLVTENSWVTITSIPDNLSIVKAAVANGKIYIMTGSANYEFDPIANTWIEKKPMPTHREPSFGIAVYDNKIYVIGGKSGLGENVNYLSTNEVYDPLTDTWETRKSMPTSREWVEANVVDGKIYVVGGVTDNFRSITTSANEVYDPVTDSWTIKKSAPIAVIKGSSAVVGQKIYIIGGIGNNDSLNLISNQIYDTQTDTWSFGASLPTPMWYTAACATTGVMAPPRIYVMGGGFTEVTNMVNVYNPALNNWTTITMPTPRAGHAIVAVNDALYVIGGGIAWHGEEPPTPGSRWTLTSKVDQYIPLGYGSVQPIVKIIIPKNQTYNQNSISLTFIVDKPFSTIFYNLDGQDNITITGNTTLTNLLNGVHNLTVYAKYAEGSIGTSEDVIFAIAYYQEPVPTATAIVVTASVVSITIVGLFYCHKKHKL